MERRVVVGVRRDERNKQREDSEEEARGLRESIIKSVLAPAGIAAVISLWSTGVIFPRALMNLPIPGGQRSVSNATNTIPHFANKPRLTNSLTTGFALWDNESSNNVNGDTLSRRFKSRDMSSKLCVRRWAIDCGGAIFSCFIGFSRS